MSPMLERFEATFLKAIATEMAAMERRLGSFTVPLSRPVRVESSEAGAPQRYRFTIGAPNDKLVLNTECDLVFKGGERLVNIEAIERDAVTVSCDSPVPLGLDEYSLIIYPWFLYEKLRQAISSIGTAQDVCPETAFRLFGKTTPLSIPSQLVRSHDQLNESQRRAVALCNDCNLAFVWGPPGTGKTVTLAHIVNELLAHGSRLLIVSTTNAAVDQALAAIARTDDGRAHIEAGHIVRIGQAAGQTHGASLPEVVARLNTVRQDRMRRAHDRVAQAREGTRQCTAALVALEANGVAEQMDLFGSTAQPSLTDWDLRDAFSRRRAQMVAAQGLPEKRRTIARRSEAQKRLCAAASTRITRLMDELRAQESSVIAHARVVLATMTTMYVSRALASERFDAIIVEEAGMAVLPSLFYCACLARDKAVMIGDPRQLPPIVTADDAFVRSAMGRSIFEVTVPDTHASDAVVMLDTQYRMHPSISRMVSELFYEGKLVSGANMARQESVAQLGPYPGEAVIVVDTAGRSTCQRRDGGSSRFNESTARLCVGLARQGMAQGVETTAIITPYVEQARLVRKLLSEARIPESRVEAHTVHRFQGNERDVVIFDTVDAQPLAPGVLLTAEGPGSQARNLVNVSISRARGKLIIIADVAYFRQRVPESIVSEMLELAAREGTVIEWTSAQAQTPTPAVRRSQNNLL